MNESCGRHCFVSSHPPAQPRYFYRSCIGEGNQDGPFTCPNEDTPSKSREDRCSITDDILQELELSTRRKNGDRHRMQRRTGGQFSRLLASRSPVPAVAYRSGFD
jgi:hypothetical protein